MSLDLGIKLSIADICLTAIGFGLTVFAAFKAKNAAEAAETASKTATAKILRADLHGDLATVLQLIDELKRLQRTKAVELLAERYSSLRSKVVAIRESALMRSDQDLSAIQDVVVRLTTLEKMIVQDPAVLENAKHWQETMTVFPLARMQYSRYENG
jgi:hypothetical protein